MVGTDAIVEIINVANWPLWAQVLSAIGVVWLVWRALYWGPAK